MYIRIDIDSKIINNSFHKKMQEKLEHLYNEYSYLCDDELMIGAHRDSYEKWKSYFYMESLVLNLPINDVSDLYKSMNLIKKHLMISDIKWRWFSLSPFYQDIIKYIMKIQMINIQRLLFIILILVVINTKYISLNTILTNIHSIHNILNYNFTINDKKALLELLQLVQFNKCILKPNIVINPDNSIQYLTECM
jgi:hypothetical protein